MYCLENFKYQTSLIKHRNQGRCKKQICNIAIYERELGIKHEKHDKLLCPYCVKLFSTQSSFSRHKTKGCIEKVKYEAELKEKVLENRRQAVAQNITNNNTNCNNHQIIINMPAMRAFGDENKDYLTTKMLLKELDNCKKINDVTSIVDKFTKLIHANPAHPENHNVLFNSLKSGYAQVYNGSDFEDRHSAEVQDRIIEHVGILFSNKVADGYQLLNDNNKEKYKEDMDEVLEDLDINFGNRDEDIENGSNTRALSRCRGAVKAALHSKKDDIEMTQNLIGE